jgi:hypothetical protein
MSNELHEANRRRWDAAAEGWARGADARGLWRRCPAEPELVPPDRELAYLRGVAGQHVCVLGSGDNVDMSPYGFPTSGRTTQKRPVFSSPMGSSWSASIIPSAGCGGSPATC